MRSTMMMSTLLLAALCFASPARADKAQLKGKIEEEIRLQEQRANELLAVGHSDETWGHDLESQAQNLDKHAAAMDARAKEYRDAGATLGDPALQKELDGFANELAFYAKHNREGAANRRKIGETIAREGHGCDAAAKEHRDQAAKLKAFLAKLK